MGQPKTTSLSLLVRLRERDEQAWNDLVHVYYPLIYSWCSRGGLRSDDIPDVVQDVFRGVSTGLAGFHRDDAKGSFRGWLKSITRHKVADFLRKRATQDQARGGTDAYVILTAVPGFDDDDEPSEIAAVLHRALELIQNDFEPETWRAFQLVQMKNESAERAAETLGISRNAVYKAKARVLQRLRQQLGELDN